MKARILWIEGKRANSPSFAPALRKKDYQVEVVQTGSAAIEMLLEYDPDLLVINAASMRTSGKVICRQAREKLPRLPILMITTDESLTAEALGVNVVLALPFTSRKLLNRMQPLMPVDEENVLHAGPIRLNLTQKKVRCQGKEAKLTPRLIQLLQTLIQKPGEVLKREDLFRSVWNTDYTGDTRTLDVHISWLRQAIEDDPRKPRFIKTIRGIGYRLDP